MSTDGKERKKQKGKDTKELILYKLNTPCSKYNQPRRKLPFPAHRPAEKIKSRRMRTPTQVRIWLYIGNVERGRKTGSVKGSVQNLGETVSDRPTATPLTNAPTLRGGVQVRMLFSPLGDVLFQSTPSRTPLILWCLLKLHL